MTRPHLVSHYRYLLRWILDSQQLARPALDSRPYPLVLIGFNSLSQNLGRYYAGFGFALVGFLQGSTCTTTLCGSFLLGWIRTWVIPLLDLVSHLLILIGLNLHYYTMTFFLLLGWICTLTRQSSVGWIHTSYSLVLTGWLHSQ